MRSLAFPFIHKPHTNTFLFCFSSSCVPWDASFSGLSIVDCSFSIHYRLFKVKVLRTKQMTTDGQT